MNDEIKYKLRRLGSETIKEIYSRKYEQKKYTNVLKKLMSSDKFVDGLQLIQGQVSYPKNTGNIPPPTTSIPEPKPQPMASTTVLRYPIHYNQELLERIAPENLRNWGKYIPIANEMNRLEERIQQGKYPYLLEGDKGIGKTLMIHTIAKKLGYALVEVRCNDSIKERHLFGAPQIDEGGSFFMAGKLTHAYKALPIYKKVMVHLDDLGGLSLEMQVAILSMCDARRSIDVNGIEMTVPDDCELFIVATTNPASYGAINPIQEALRSRFIGEILPYPKQDGMKKILSWKDIPIDTVQEPLLTVASNTHDLRIKNDVDYVISPRDIEQFNDCYRDNIGRLKKTHKTALEECIRQTILIKYSDASERELIRVRCQETFGVTVT